MKTGGIIKEMAFQALMKTLFSQMHNLMNLVFQLYYHS